jgi:hypothetical protein
LIILIMFGYEYNLWSSSLCCFLQSSVTSSLFGPNILLSTLFSNTLSLSEQKKKSIGVTPLGITDSRASTYWTYTFIGDSADHV